MRRLIAPVLLAGCVVSHGDDADTDASAYEVAWSTDPSPLQAGQSADFTLQVRYDGEPVQDLQQNHDRMVHTIFVSADLRTFRHLHQEDVAPITADDLRNGRFHFPVALPDAGTYRIVFDYAHRNLWLQTLDELVVEGAPAMAPEPDLSGGDEVVVDGVDVKLVWDVAPVVGEEARWHVELATEAGDPITDVVQWMGADAHCAYVSADLVWAQHTHAWTEGMADMAPSMTMPHVYDGPTIDFRDTFPVPGGYRMWVQFARAGAPDQPLVASFPVDVAP